MRLPKLFKRAVNGKTLEWEVEVKDAYFRTISGYTDGVKTVSEWTCCEAKNVGKKNATTPEQQAMSKAKAMWTKRVELGSFESISDIDKPVHFKPMLAHDFNDYEDKIKFPVFSQPKLDGVRCIVRADGMWSRNGKQIISAPHIFKVLKPLFEINPDLIFDGELYADKSTTDFNTIISCVRKTKPTLNDLNISTQCIQYHVYDLPSYDDIFTERFKHLSKILTGYNSSIVVVKTDQIDNMNDLTAYYEDYMSDGYEGQMIRLNNEYENKRSKSLLKHKMFVDVEFEIKGVEEGKGNLSGKVGRLNFEINGKPFDAAVNGDWEYIEKLWRNKEELVGKMATVKYFELTTDGLPRFPKVINIGREDYE